MKKKILSLLMAGAMVLGMLCLSACGGGTQQGGAPSGSGAAGTAGGAAPIDIKVATVGNDKHQSTIAATYFKEKIEELSGGQITVTIFPNGSLGSEREAAESVKLGTLQMTIVTTDGTLPSWVPEVQVLSIPYLFSTKEEAYYALDNILQDEFAPLFEAQGFKHLAFCELGFRHFTNNVREVVSAADMKGLSIRVQEAPIWFALMDSLGATATPINFSELYTALQQGTVDGQENPIASIATSAFDEVQKYMVLDGHTYGAESIIMNLAFYDSLSDEAKGWVDEAAAYASASQRAAVDELEGQYLEQIKSNGVTVSEPDIDSFKAAVDGMYLKDAVKALVPPALVEKVMAAVAEFNG